MVFVLWGAYWNAQKLHQTLEMKLTSRTWSWVRLKWSDIEGSRANKEPPAATPLLKIQRPISTNRVFVGESGRALYPLFAQGA